MGPRTEALPHRRRVRGGGRALEGDGEVHVAGRLRPFRAHELPVELGRVRPCHHGPGHHVLHPDRDGVAVVAGREHLDAVTGSRRLDRVDALVAAGGVIDGTEHLGLRVAARDGDPRDRQARLVPLLVLASRYFEENTVDVVVELKGTPLGHADAAVRTHHGGDIDPRPSAYARAGTDANSRASIMTNASTALRRRPRPVAVASREIV